MTDDPNRPYVPVRYPKMLYATADASIIVMDEREEASARAQGYTDTHNLDPNADGLDVLSHEHLISIMLGLTRDRLAKVPPSDIIASIRAERAESAAAAARDAQTALSGQDGPADEYTALSDDELRALIEARDGAKPHHKTGRAKLLSLARGEAA